MHSNAAHSRFTFARPLHSTHANQQLFQRHWQIQSVDGSDAEHVRGEGVVGRYPLLSEEGYTEFSTGMGGMSQQGGLRRETFVYQSCSGPREPPFTFQGELTMVAGSLSTPGEHFDVRVAPFLLTVYPFTF